MIARPTKPLDPVTSVTLEVMRLLRPFAILSWPAAQHQSRNRTPNATVLVGTVLHGRRQRRQRAISVATTSFVLDQSRQGHGVYR
jgi:hypothetical protein